MARRARSLSHTGMTFAVRVLRSADSASFWRCSCLVRAARKFSLTVDRNSFTRLDSFASFAAAAATFCSEIKSRPSKCAHSSMVSHSDNNIRPTSEARRTRLTTKPSRIRDSSSSAATFVFAVSTNRSKSARNRWARLPSADVSSALPSPSVKTGAKNDGSKPVHELTAVRKSSSEPTRTYKRIRRNPTR